MRQQHEDVVSKPRVAEVLRQCSVLSGHEIHTMAVARRDRCRLALQTTARCQLTIVFGFTKIRLRRHPENHRQARIQKRRSASRNRGLNFGRLRTRSGCRRQRFLAIKVARTLKMALKA